MAQKRNRRLKPAELAADEEVYAALKSIAGYAPANPAYSLAAVEAAHTQFQQARQKEVQTAAAADAARDDANTVEWDFHDLMGGVKDQVVAQFGRNSNEVQSVGLKKPEEYKRPSGKGKKDGGETK